jgi:hypothetical protein
MYLYVPQKENFDDIPEQLLTAFGKPEFSMTIDLSKRDNLATEDIYKVQQNLNTQGYHLQMPPHLESMLQQP